MIAFIRGMIVEKTENSVTVDVGGVGYQLHVASSLADRLTIGSEAQLSTYFHVREQSQDLFGFSGVAARALFTQLISVSGVGPKMGLSLLNLGEERSIRQAIANEDIAFLTGASGVGKRLAEKVIVDLKDKIGVMPGEIDSSPFADMKPQRDEALEALIALGYTKNDAVDRLRSIDGKLSVEDRVKQALVQGIE